jgi:hypothetical protein
VEVLGWMGLWEGLQACLSENGDQNMKKDGTDYMISNMIINVL